MKRFFFFLIIIEISCVSSKKYHLLETRMTQLQNDLATNHNQLNNSKNDLIYSLLRNDSLKSVIHQQTNRIIKIESTNNAQSEKIMHCQGENIKITQENQKLSKQIDDLTQISKVNYEIMKRTMEDLNAHQLKVLNLSLALQRNDSLQISSVKKPKKQLSEEKLKKSLEKVGFVFY